MSSRFSLVASTRAKKNLRRKLRQNRKLQLRFEVLEDRRVLATEIALAQGNLSQISPQVSDPVTVGEYAYFAATTNERGTELWKTDGTEAGTVQVKDLNPGIGSSILDSFTNVGGTLFFRAIGIASSGLWKSDGTEAGTTFVSTLPISENYKFYALGNQLMFFAQSTPSVVGGLYRSDGTAAGTIQLTTMRIVPTSVLAIGNQLYFDFFSSTAGIELWKSDGTIAGTVQVHDISPLTRNSNPSNFANVNGTLYFSANDGSRGVELWKSDGTSAGTTLVKDIFPSSPSIQSSNPASLVNLNGTLYFSAEDPSNGIELWKSDGTDAGTVMVKDIRPGTRISSQPKDLTVVGSQFFFSATDGTFAYQLWKSDGTTAGTLKVKDVVSVQFASGMGPMLSTGSRLYFRRGPGEIWTSDGTSAGTIPLKSFPVQGGVATNSLVNLNGKLLFATTSFITQISDPGLWQSTGAVSGTTRISNQIHGKDYATTKGMIDIDGTLYHLFRSRLCRSDGTPAGSSCGPSTPGSITNDITNLNGSVYYLANNNELKSSDGTVSGTRTVKTIGTSGTYSLHNANGTLYFAANDGTTGSELWKSDGTAAGTVLVKDIYPGANRSRPHSLVNIGSTLYFLANDGTTGVELWKSDGTTAGTVRVKDISPGTGSAFGPFYREGYLTVAGGMLYFAADNPSTGLELWKSDGTDAGTQLVRDIRTGSSDSNPTDLTNIGGTLYFEANDGTSGSALWKSDGSFAGTTKVKDVRVSNITEVGNKIYFSGSDGISGSELWTTDGTTAGTTLVQDIVPGPSSSFPSGLSNLNGELYFTARDGIDFHLWKSDSLGTRAVLDSNGKRSPIVEFSAPYLSPVGAQLFFIAKTNLYANALFVMRETDLGDAPFLTTVADNGAKHVAYGPILGSLRDSQEPDGIPSVLTNGDDLNGTDDEDGLVSWTELLPGNAATLKVNASNTSAQTKLNIWFDWNHDSDWNDAGENVAASMTVTNGENTINFTVPASALWGPTYARLRISNDTIAAPTGFAKSGEVEDYAISLLRSVNLDLPSTASNSIAIRKSGSNVQVVDLLSSSVLFSAPLTDVKTIRINGSDSQSDTVLVDYASGGFFSLPSGIDLRGQGGNDVLTVTGTGNTLATHSSNTAGQRQLATSEGASSNAILFSDFETLTFNGLQSFNAIGTLDIGANTLTVGATNAVDLGTATLIAGGRFTADRIVLGNNESLSGFGTIETIFSGEQESTITLSGAMSIGNSASNSGFATLGTVSVGANTLTLLDADQASMGSATTLGTSTTAGVLIASNGLQIRQQATLSGFGTIQSPDNSSKPLTNSGTIRGSSAANPITITGFANGVGTIDLVTIAGTISPGLGPANVNFGTATYAGNAIIEVNGTSAGNQYDRIDHSGRASLGGVLDIRLDSQFVPIPGTLFTLFNAPANLVGQFSSVLLPAAPSGQSWELAYTSDSVILQLVALSLSIQPGSISENGGRAIATVRRSNINLSQSAVVTLLSSDTSEATVPATVTIPAGQSSVTFAIDAVDDNLFDGNQIATISVIATAYANDSKPLTVTDYETLSLTLDQSSISERDGLATATVTRSNTDVASAITVSLTNGDSSELSLPATVTIPANQASVTFALTAVDDSLLDGTQNVTIGANSAGYLGSSTSIAVTDYETIAVSYDKSSIAENGETAIATVTRSNTDQAAAITVTLTNSDSSEAVFQNTVTIPANQASASFAITAVDDTLLDGMQIVTVTASATGYVSGSKAIDVTDVELITLTIDKSRISENGGTATGTVTRGNTDIGLPITVNLSSSDTTEATVPATVTIPANQNSATFTITGVLDHLLDGTQSVAIVVSSSGYFSDVESIDVTDAETFNISFDKFSISENGGTAIGTVTRSNTNIAQAVTVSLSNIDPSEATVPSSVTIPAGQASTTFAVTAVDDNLLDGDQLVTITASASQYLNGSGTITIADSETLALVINTSSISENGGTTTGRVTRSNTDIALPLVVTLSSSDTSEAVVPNAVTIPANQSFVVFTITAVDDTLLDGAQSVAISASATGYFGTSQSLQVTDAESLSVAINAGAINEVGGSAIGTVTRSNTDIAQPLTVNLTSSLTSEATVPATVSIPANAASATFTITAVDDGVLDGTKTVVITASSQGYADGSRTVDVTDSVLLSLTFAANSISENGGSTSATVTRSNSNTSLPLTVQLLSSDLTEASVPATITIPANQASVTFPITGVDDTLLDGTQSVTITASATGYQNGMRNLEVADAESLAITISPSSISENGGMTTATVTRSNSDNAQPLVVTLLSSDTSEVDVPTIVTIPANQASATFTILAVDDTLLDGIQTVLITASETGYTDGTRTLEVTDSESLTVTIDSASISELGGIATGTVTRSNTDRDQPLTVALQSNDTSEANIPASVTIPAGQASATFSITAVDDALLDGSQSGAITASATGYSNGSQTFDVTDFETISVVLSLSTISENGGSTTGTATRSNTDNSQPLTVTLLSSDTTEATVPISVTIPANQSSVNFTIASVDDAFLDGSQAVAITAASTGYSSGSETLNVTDFETISVILGLSTISEKGGSATGTVTRSNTDNSQPLTVTLLSSDTTEATVPTTVVIPANQASVSFIVAAVDDTLLDGTQSVTITVSSPGYSSGSQALSVTDAETLTVTIDVPSISENGGLTTGAVTRSNTDVGLPIVITLSSGDTSEAIVPTSVTIPAGQTSATFAITAVDDALLDGTQDVTLTASSPGYGSGSQTLSVTDAETLTLTLDANSISENGGLANGIVARSNTDISNPLTVMLTSSDTSEATVPQSVTIPANQSLVSFSISAVDDDLLDGLQVVNLTAAAVGYASAQGNLDVTDAESVSLTINAPLMSEKGGKLHGLVTRNNTDIGSPLTVNLQSNDTTEANVPTSVIIPANASSVSFAIDAVDDALLDGTQTVSIQVSAANYAGSSASLNVTDSESLSISINVSSMIEKNGIAIGTVSRSNTDTAQALVVQLVSDDVTEATVPASVTIPANQSQVTFTIASVNDHLIDGNQTVHITASASDYENGTASLIVRDDDPNFPWQNARNRFDVNNDGLVSPIDALLVINALNVRMILTPELPDPFIPVRYVDVSGDGLLSPIDALLVINELNRIRNSGEGEFTSAHPTSSPSTQTNPFEAVIDLLVEDQILGGKRKRSW